MLNLLHPTYINFSEENYLVKSWVLGAKEITWWLRVVVALSEALSGLVHTTNMVAHNHQ